MIASRAKGGGGLGGPSAAAAAWRYARIADATLSSTAHGTAVDIGDEEIEWTISAGAGDSNPKNGSWYSLGIPVDIGGNSLAGVTLPRNVEFAVELTARSGDGNVHVGIGLISEEDYGTALAATAWGLAQEPDNINIRGMIARLATKSTFGGGPTVGGGDAIYGTASQYLVSTGVPGFRASQSQVFNAGIPTVFSAQNANPAGMIATVGQSPRLIVIGGRDGAVAAGSTIRGRFKYRIHQAPPSVP